MLTIILPGYSLNNKQWAEAVARSLKQKAESKVLVHCWRHWDSSLSQGISLSIKFELGQINKEVHPYTKDIGVRINVVAKSMGTRVAMQLLDKHLILIDKLILCGIPTTSDIARNIYSRGLSKIDPKKVICFQNTSDPFASFFEVRKLIASINKNIKVVEKLRTDHNYPYYEDFGIFLNS